jgi:hypothetical protein
MLPEKASFFGREERNLSLPQITLQPLSTPNRLPPPSTLSIQTLSLRCRLPWRRCDEIRLCTTSFVLRRQFWGRFPPVKVAESSTVALLFCRCYWSGGGCLSQSHVLIWYSFQIWFRLVGFGFHDSEIFPSKLVVLVLLSGVGGFRFLCLCVCLVCFVFFFTVYGCGCGPWSFFYGGWPQNPKGSVCDSKTWNGLVRLTRKGLVTDVLDSSLDLSSYALFETVVFGDMIFSILWYSRFVEIFRFRMVMSTFTLVLLERAVGTWICYHVGGRSIHYIKTLNVLCIYSLFILFCNLVSYPYAGSLGCVYDQWILLE